MLATSVDPLIPQDVLQAISSTTSIIASAMGAAAMLAQSRAAAIMVFNDCQFSIVDDIAFPDNILGLQFGVEENRFQRGSVIGNLVFVAAVSLVFVGGITGHCVWTRRHRRPQQRWDSDGDAAARAKDAVDKDRHHLDDAAGDDQELVSISNAHQGGTNVLSEDLLGGNDNYDPLFDDEPSPLTLLATDKQQEQNMQHVDMLRAYPAIAAPPSPLHHRVLQTIKRAASTAVDRVAEPWDTWQHSAAKCRFPSILIIPISFVYDATTSSSLSILVYSRESYDVGLGLFGLTMSVLVLVALAVNVLRHFPLRLVRTHRKHAYPVLQRHRWLRYLLYPRAHWSSRPKRRTNNINKEMTATDPVCTHEQPVAGAVDQNDDPFSDVDSRYSSSTTAAISWAAKGNEDIEREQLPTAPPASCGGSTGRPSAAQDPQGRSEADLRLFKSSYHFVFDDLAWPAYTLLEFFASFTVGICVAVGISNRQVCLILAIVSITPVALTCAVLLRLRPILTRASFFFTTATNLCCLASCALVLASMAGSTDALEQYPALLAFLGVAVTLLRSITEYSVFGMWLWYTICGKGEPGAEAVGHEEASPNDEEEHGAEAIGQRVKSRSKRLVMAVLAESSDDDSDESYDSAKSGSSSASSRSSPTPEREGGDPIEASDHGDSVSTPHVPLRQLGALDDEISLVFGDHESMVSGGGRGVASSDGSSHVREAPLVFSELDAEVAKQRKQRRGTSTALRSGKQRSLTFVEPTAQQAMAIETSASDFHEEDEDPLTLEERQDLERYAALKADIHATLSSSGGATGGGGGVRMRQSSVVPASGGSGPISQSARMRAISVAAPPRDVMRRFSNMSDSESNDDLFSRSLDFDATREATAEQPGDSVSAMVDMLLRAPNNDANDNKDVDDATSN